MRRKPGPPKDYFGNEIKLHDRYFYGSPPTAGTVIKVNLMSIVLDIGAKGWAKTNMTMNCKSPEKGVCLDKIPEDIFNP